MKRTLLTIITSLSAILANAQGWQATNLTNVTYLAINELEVHNNNLYGIVFSGFASTVHKLDAGNTSWTELTLTGTTGIPAFLKSTGSKFYLGAIGTIESNLFVSTDGINYTLADTTGLPQENGGFARMYGLDYFNGKLLLNLGSKGYWISNEGQGNWTKIDVATLLNGGANPVAYANGKLFTHDNFKFYVSTDYGQTWPEQATNLPSDYACLKLIADQTTNRLYIFGGNTGYYGFYYSDNDGVSWTEIDISSFVTTDHLGGEQVITALYAKGETVYFCLENEQASTHPNVVGTTTGIDNFALDTVGLPPNAAGAVTALHFAEYNGELAMALNVIDVYLRGVGTGVEEEKAGLNIGLYPNPTQEELFINTNGIDIESIDIVNSLGQVVISNAIYTNRIDVSELKEGIHFIRFNSASEVLGTKRFVKK